MLIDPELHMLFSPTQLALGLSMAFSNCFTDFPFCYSRVGTEDRRLHGILNLRNLYDNFFDRYCSEPFLFNAPAIASINFLEDSIVQVGQGRDDAETTPVWIAELCYPPNYERGKRGL